MRVLLRDCESAEHEAIQLLSCGLRSKSLHEKEEQAIIRKPLENSWNSNLIPHLKSVTMRSSRDTKGVCFMREKTGDILWGLVLIAVGILIGGKVFGLIDFSLYFPGWWCLILIVPCAIGIVKHGFQIFNTAGLLLGIAFLLQQNGYIEAELIEKLMVPAIFFIIGFSILGRALFAGPTKKYAGNQHYAATFAGNTVMPQGGEAFEGCSVDAVFGGVVLNLKNVEIQDGAVIDASAIFGGVDIMVPENVRVKVHSTSLFGGAKQKRGGTADGPVLYVNTLCMFGGVDVK